MAPGHRLPNAAAPEPLGDPAHVAIASKRVSFQVAEIHKRSVRVSLL